MVVAFVAIILNFSEGYTLIRSAHGRTQKLLQSSLASSSAETVDISSVEIPTFLPSECGVDYVPLATMLATGL